MLTEEERGDAEQSEDGAADGVEARLQQDDPEGGTQQPHHRQLGNHQPGQEEEEATVVSFLANISAHFQAIYWSKP